MDPENNEVVESLLILIEEIQHPGELENILANLPEEIGQSSRAKLLLGKAYARAGDWTKALDIAKETVQSDSENSEGWILMAKAQAALGEIQRAQSSFRLAMGRSASEPRVAIEFGRFLVEHDREEEAARILTAVEYNLDASNPDSRSPALHNLLAAVYARQGQTVLAVQQLNRSLALDPNQPQIRRMLNEMNQ